MPRAIRLPPLETEHVMANDGFRDNIIRNSGLIDKHRRRQSVLTSSDAKTDSLPIDCILVYNLGNDKNDDDDDEIRNTRILNMSRSEQRRTFEDYLVRKQGLIIQKCESKSKEFGYVKVHTPFNILLLTAENIRMRLPIEEITDKESDSSQTTESSWHRFMARLKRPFRLDPSLTKYDFDYYTAIYSRNIDKFQDLFVKLHGSKESYFTSSERSLLTHELLSRAHFDGDDEDGDDNPQLPVVRKPVMNTVMGLRKGSRRPGIDRLINRKAYHGYFPLHESLRDNVRSFPDEELNDREKLQKHWATMRCCLRFQPLFLIRSYMGEKVAFYFAFLGFYNQMLIPAAFVGLIIFIYGTSSVFNDQPTSDICGDYGRNTDMCPRCDIICPFWKLSDSCLYSKISYVFDNTATVIFAILMSLWARWFVELWKRRQAVLQYDWDSIDFEGHLEPIRPEFENQANRKGEPEINPVTGIKEPHVPTKKRIPFYLIAAAVVLFAMVIVCATVFATIVYRVQMDYVLKTTPVKTYSSIIITVTSAVMNLICSVILSIFYYWIARKLTDLELHKYQSKYDDSLTMKIYLFQFVNFYSSLFYIAFFKGRFSEYPSKYGETGSGDFTEQCDPAGCLVELSIQLIIIMIGKQIIGTLFEFFNATRRTCTRICFNRGKDNEEAQWEKDNELNDFNSDTLIDEYLEIVIQFGFVTLFVVAFPLAPLFALVNNLIEVRLDAWKFLSKYKRPIPYKASDIGIWSDIISGISYLAVLTNAIVIAWTSEFIPKMAYRSLESTGTSLVGYINWTLSSFPIVDYNLTGTMPSGAPNGTYCRYRDFRSPSGPYYSETSVYWNVIAARLAFIVVFEHVIFFIVYVMEWLVPDVPKNIQDKIDHERYIDQRERWVTETNEKNFKHAAIASEAITKMVKLPNGNIKSPNRTPEKSPNEPDEKSPVRPPKRRTHIRVRISPGDKQ